jgi:tRNA threonylcarbamoyladenosine biosynthesis protein TsaE
MITKRCPTEADTLATAQRLASILRPGDVLILSGGLGAGKTLFTQGLAAGLGVEEPVVSPSFVLVRQYKSGFMPVVHVDAYRLGSLNEFEDLEAVDLATDGVLVIEWGTAVEAGLPEDHLVVEILMEEDQTRLLTFLPRGSWADRDLELVA